MTEQPDIDRHHRPARNPAAAQVAVGDRLVVTHPTAVRSVVLDPVSAQLWSWFDAEVTVGELADDVADALGLEPQAATASLVAMVDELRRAGYLAEPADERYVRRERYAAVAPDT